MNHPNITALRIDLYDCMDKPPRDYIAPIEPENALRRSWIPQTMGDQIWVMWEFESDQKRKEFEESLPIEVSRWIDRSVIEYAIPYGWNSRDANGFVTKRKEK